MSKRYYPAVLERDEGGTFAAWFPDFPDCVAGGTSQEAALAKAELALAAAVEALAERDQPLPLPSPFDAIALPDECRLVSFVAIGVLPPDPSERVNVYLPKSLIAKADARAAELGMSRSSFFGLAISGALGVAGIRFLKPEGTVRLELIGKPGPKR